VGTDSGLDARLSPKRNPPAASRSRARAKRTGVETLLLQQPWDDLIPHLLRVGADADLALERLKSYMRELCEWNRNVSNLISGNDEKRFVERHVLESLQPAYWLKESGAERWADLGSGGGLPALPLIIAGIGEAWTLVESRRTKTLFLRRVIDALGLPNVEVVNERIETVVGDTKRHGVFQGFTSRATLTMAPTLAMAAPLVAPGGDAFLWKGSGREQEMKDSVDWESAWRLEGLLGIGSGVNVVCRFKRI
jgi:16S rRNA (guanine527-N7)-methyltransferase